MDLIIRFFIQAGSRTLELELKMLSSTHHVEMNPSDAGFQDRYVVQEIIKEMAKNRPIDTKGKKGFKGRFFLFLMLKMVLICLFLLTSPSLLSRVFHNSSISLL